MRLAHSPRLSALIALALLVPAPSIGVYLAMTLESTRGEPLGMAAFAASKFWILVLPLVWMILVDRQRPSLSPPHKGGLIVGALLGSLIAVCIAGAYTILQDLIDVAAMREAAVRNGIGTHGRFLALAVYWILLNSLLEEYVWRWFVFRKAEALVGGKLAVLLSALFFSAHHFFALYAQTDMRIALLGTLGVFIGGSVWSWCYLRYRSIWPGYLSHVIADVAVFSVGWWALFGEAARSH